MAVLLIGYIFYNNKTQQDFLAKQHADSLRTAAMMPPKTLIDTTKKAVAIQDAVNDSLRKTLPPAYNGTESIVVLENKKLRLEFLPKVVIQ